jgi:hypothetical protein
VRSPWRQQGLMISAGLDWSLHVLAALLPLASAGVCWLRYGREAMCCSWRQQGLDGFCGPGLGPAHSWPHSSSMSPAVPLKGPIGPGGQVLIMAPARLDGFLRAWTDTSTILAAQHLLASAWRLLVPS